MPYAKKVGGYAWKQQLALMRQDLMAASLKLEALVPAAQTTQTKADVLEISNIVLRAALGVEELLRMEEK